MDQNLNLTSSVREFEGLSLIMETSLQTDSRQWHQSITIASIAANDPLPVFHASNY